VGDRRVDVPLQIQQVSARAEQLARKVRVWFWIGAGLGLLYVSCCFLPGHPLLVAPLAIGALAALLPTHIRYRSLRIERDLEYRRLDAVLHAPVPRPDVPDAHVTQPAVLYLRSFDDDRRAAVIKGDLTEEELLVQLLGRIGTVVAVGRPGEVIRPVGAHRVYLPDGDWQSAVETLLGTARLVVIRTGRSGGLLWELKRVVESLRPEQLLVAVDDPEELRAFFSLIREVHPQVPSDLRVGWRSIGSLRGFVIFDGDWQPRMLRVPSAAFWAYKGDHESYAGVKLARTLRPLFARMGVPWPRPPLNDRMVALFLATVAFLTLLAFGFLK
jgi:hypothetical protein